MQFEHITQNVQKTSRWAAGETTELFIYPNDSNFLERKFLWRLSVASVKDKQSTFTPLYSVIRWIIPMDGSLFLRHKSDGKSLYRITLQPFQSHCFRGDWETQSEGKVKDFNLMYKEGVDGEIHHERLSAAETTFEDLLSHAFVPSNDQIITIGLYAVNGSFHLEGFTINKEELLVIHLDAVSYDQALKKIITINETLVDTGCDIIVSEVCYETVDG